MSGPFHGRREDRRLLTGRGQYTSDWNLPQQLHACFVRADRAHARILGVDISAARAHPGVAAVYLAADFADLKLVTPPQLAGYPGRGGSKVISPPWTYLATDTVRYVGEAVALVIAESAVAARDAAELVHVDYEDLSAVVSFESAMAADAPQLHSSIPGNICFDYEYGDQAKVAAAIASAHHVAQLTLESPRVAPNPMESRAVLAQYDAEKDHHNIWCSHQGAGMMRHALAVILGLPAEKVRVQMNDVGGGFGARSGPYSEYPLLMIAAKKLARPVKWVASRSENFLTDAHGRALRLSGELALDQAGKILAFRMHWLCDQGAYLTQAGPLINTSNGNVMGCGVYTMPLIYGRHQLVMTNTCPTNAYRGAGRPDVAYLLERLVDEAAIGLNIDRVELRRRNLVPKEAMPYTTPLGSVYDSGDYPGQLEMAVRESDWAGFAARRAASASKGMLRGLGIATFVEPAGGGAIPKDQSAIRFDAKGTALLYTCAGNHGQSHETVYADLVAEAMGVTPESVQLRQGDPDGPQLMGAGTIGSRSTQAAAAALKVAADEVIRKGTELAATMLETAVADVEFREGQYVIKGTDRKVSMEEVIRKHAGGTSHPLDSMGEVPTIRTFPSGAHIAEVEIDPATGMVRLDRYTAVDDAGHVINHTLVEGQIHGGMAQGIGQVFGEHAMYDEATGQLLAGSFMDYYMPRAGMLGEVRVLDHSMPSPSNPLGVKGVGEAGTTGSLPAVMNAVVDALRALGINHFDMPATPARLWQVIHDASARRRAA